MSITVEQLIKKLNEYPANSVIATQDSSATFTFDVRVEYSDRYPGHDNVVFIEADY